MFGTISVVTKKRAQDWLFVYGNLEQQPDSSSRVVFVCKWVDHLVSQEGQFQVGKFEMECFRYEIASTVMKCSDFGKRNAFAHLP